MNKILVAGGTGFIGKALIAFLKEHGYELNILTRREIGHQKNINYYQWDIEKAFIDKKAFDGVNAIINLTGVNIGEKRWTPKRKQEIIDSRIRSIDLLLKYVTENNFTIQTFISSSAVGYYGAITQEQILNENSENGDNFLAAVCKQWEQTAKQFEKIGSRVIILRKGAIIGKDGGMYKKLMPWAKIGINTSLGNGNQHLPWIDIHDLVRIYDFILNHSEIKGVFNTVASESITMNDFSKYLLLSFGKKIILPKAPAFLIKLLYGEMSSMLLKGTKVSNEKIKQLGFQFKFNSIEQSLLKLK